MANVESLSSNPTASVVLDEEFRISQSALFDIKVTLLVAGILTATIAAYLHFQGIAIGGWAPFVSTSGGFLILSVATQILQISHKKGLHQQWDSVLDGESLSDVNLDKIEELVALGASANRRDVDGKSLLYLASHAGEEAKVERLLNLGAKVNVCDKDEVTPLFAAVYGNRLLTVNLLLKEGANANALIKKSLLTPLHYAANYGYHIIAKTLLNAEAKVDALDRYGNTPLHFAIQSESKEAVKKLLDFDASLKIKDKKGRSALQIAVQLFSLSICQLLVERGADLSTVDNEGNSLLHQAVAGDDRPILSWLISQIKDLNPKNNAGDTPLVQAAKENKKWALEALIVAGACNKDAKA